MTKDQVVRAWKDEDYRLGLSKSELSALPQNPAGLVELAEDEMLEARGRESFSLAITIALTIEIYSAIATCHACPESILVGGSCAYGTSGCC
jgi:mersacidin/lichenicidin family type 2 lantibiotic